MLVADEVSGPVDRCDSRNGEARAALLTSLVGQPRVKAKFTQLHDRNLSEAGRLAKCSVSVEPDSSEHAYTADSHNELDRRPPRNYSRRYSH